MRKSGYNRSRLCVVLTAMCLLLGGCGAAVRQKDMPKQTVAVRTETASRAGSDDPYGQGTPGGSVTPSGAGYEREQQPEILSIGGKPGEGGTAVTPTPTPEATITPTPDPGDDTTPTPIPTPTSTVGKGSFSKSDFTLLLNGNRLTVGDDFLPYVEKMGSKARVEQGQACIGGGFDTNYYYGNSLSVYTVAKNGGQIIYDIYITGGSFTTVKGVKVGKTTKDDIRELYGEPTSSKPSADNYSLGEITLSFEYDDGVVSGIDVSKPEE